VSKKNTQEIYDNNSSKWLRLSPSSLSDFTARPFVFDACGKELQGKSVLDIGCGEGYCARELKRRGAGAYLGIDLSSNMIEAAREQELKEPLGVEYLQSSVIDFAPSRSYELSIAVFLFNYLTVEEMHRSMSMVYKALQPGGHFIFTVPHPFFPFVDRGNVEPFYFSSEGKNYFRDIDQQFQGEIWKRDGTPLHVQCVHKTFEAYFDGLKNAGFKHMPHIKELTVTQDLADTDPDFFSPLLHQPLHVLFKVKK
jgi:SAM-dependent methyltransferase